MRGVACPVCYNVVRTKTNALVEAKRGYKFDLQKLFFTYFPYSKIIFLERLEHYMGVKLLEFKTRGLKPLEIEVELQNIRDDFIANGIHYDPIRNENQSVPESDNTENEAKNDNNSASVTS